MAATGARKSDAVSEKDPAPPQATTESQDPAPAGPAVPEDAEHTTVPPTVPASKRRPPLLPGETRLKGEMYGDRTCVVNSNKCNGPAVNGMVCSAHAMHYRSDGARRAEQ